MRSATYLFIVLLALALAAPECVLSTNGSDVSAEEKTASTEGAAAGTEAEGRGEGYEPESERAKRVEIPATFGPIVTDTAIPIEKGKFAIQSTFGHSFVTGTFTRNCQRDSAGGDFQSFFMNWKLTYGLIDNLEVYALIPYERNWAGNVDEPGPHGERFANSGGLGDVNLTLKYRLVEEAQKLPTVTALFSTDFPSGKFKHLNPGALGTDVTGCGSYVFTLGINISKYIKPFILYGNLWYSMPTSSTDGNGRRYHGDFVTVNAAAEYPLSGKWVALLELTGSSSGGCLFGPQANVPQNSLLSIVPGIEYMATDKFSLAVGLSIDLIGKNTDATITPVLSMVYAF